MIDLKKLEKLVALMVENDLTEIDLADEKENVTLRRGSAPGSVAGPVQMISPPVVSPAPATPIPAPASTTESAPATGPTIDSPMVGSFYSASSPDAEPFVKVGDTVTADTVVCIVEAMKVFNEIKAEQSGKVKAVLVSNGDAVEFGQPLFELE
ncbi:MAG: acetyl-CoA carboxylase biotin carboxyl carrier protein [Planctomycetota bacterium]